MPLGEEIKGDQAMQGVSRIPLISFYTKMVLRQGIRRASSPVNLRGCCSPAEETVLVLTMFFLGKRTTCNDSKGPRNLLLPRNRATRTDLQIVPVANRRSGMDVC
jgi:hypothetical protein